MINLSIVIKTRGIAYLIVEDSEILDFGIKRFKGDKTRNNILEYLISIIYVGDISTVLVNEISDKQDNSTQAMRFIQDLELELHDKQVSFVIVPNQLIKQAFDNAPRYKIAERLTEELPHISHLLPKRKRLWESEDAAMLLFDSAAQLRAMKMI
jgi:hypothetical protein